jgi:hypothetical protein
MVGTPGAGTAAGAATGRTLGAAAGFLVATGAAAWVFFNSREERQIKDAIGDVTGEAATDEQYETMSDEIHDRKAHGEGGTKNKKGDFTFKELKEIAEELFGGDS